MKNRGRLIAVGFVAGLLVLLGWILYARLAHFSPRKLIMLHCADPLTLPLLLLGFSKSWRLNHKRKMSIKMILSDSLWMIGSMSFGLGVVSLPVLGGFSWVLVFIIALCTTWTLASGFIIIMSIVSVGKFVSSLRDDSE